MAISDTQKIDNLYKKLIYGVSKTDVAGNKSPSNEAIPSPLLVRGDSIWNESGLIPATPPASSAGVVAVRTGTSSVAPTADSTVVPSTRTWLTSVQNWIPSQFNSLYTVKVYAAALGATNPQATGTSLPPDGINNDGWVFDYESGVLNFPDTNVPAVLAGKVIFIAGYTYTGTIGIANSNTLGDLSVSGNTISATITDSDIVLDANGTGSVILNDNSVVQGNLLVNGTTTSTGVVTAPTFNGNVTSTGTSTFSNIAVTGGNVTGLTTLAATTAALDAVQTGNATVTGGQIDGTVIGATTPAAATFTTVNGGNATFNSINNTPIGNTTPSTAAFTTLAASGLVDVTDDTQSTLVSNGAVVVAGGVGIAKNLNVGGDAIITGNLTVQGTSTTVNSTSLSTADVNITLASGATTGAQADGAGLTVAGADATLIYSGANDDWTFNKNVKIPNLGLSGDLAVTGNITATGSVAGASVVTANAQVTGGAITNTPVSGSTGQFTTLASPSVTLTGGSIADTTITGSTGSFTTMTTADAQVTGGAITGTPISGSTGAFTSVTTANAQVTGGSVTGLTTLAATTAALDAVQTGNAQVTGGAITNTPISGSTGSFTTLAAASFTAESINNTPIGNAVASTGAFTSLQATSTTTASLDVTGASVLDTVTANVVTINTSLTNLGTTTANGAATFNGDLTATNNVTISPVTGVVTIAPTVTGSMTNMDVNAVSLTTANAIVTGGTLNGASIGATTPSTGVFTTLTAASFTADSINNTPIGNVTPSTGVFTTLDATGGITGNIVTAAQPAITSVGTLTSLAVTGETNSGSVVTANAQVTGGAITSTPISGSTGAFTTLEASGGITGNIVTAAQPAITSVGTLTDLTVAGNVIAGTTSTTNLSTGNAQVTGGAITNTPISGSTVGATTLTTADAQITGGAITGTPISGSTVGATTLTATTGTVTNLSSSNVNVTGGAITGTPVSGSTGAFTTLSSSGEANLASVVTANAQVTGGAITSTPISGSTGSFTTLNASGTTNVVDFNANANIASTSTGTGTITVVGGVGLTGNIYVGLGAHINASNSALDTVISGQTNNNLVFVSSATDQVVVGGNTLVPGATFSVDATDSMLLPSGTTAQRPVTPAVGMMRFNKTYNYMEYWNGATWASTDTVFTLITDQQFTGDGLTDSFTLSSASTTNSTIVSINGVVQIPGLSYSVAGTTMQFTEPPLTTDVIDVRVLVTTQTVSGSASPNGFNQITTDDADIGVWTGTSSSAKRWKFDAATGAFLPVGSAMAIGSEAAPVDVITVKGSVVSAPNATDFGTSATTIASFPLASYRTAKFVVSIFKGSTFQAAEVLVTHNGTDAYSSAYAIVSTTGTPFATFTAVVNGANVELQAAGTAAGNTAKVSATYIVV